MNAEQKFSFGSIIFEARTHSNPPRVPFVMGDTNEVYAPLFLLVGGLT